MSTEYAEHKPYKGTESYQVEDALLFFGRKSDADAIVAKILSSRMTLLHAQSGAGKTSVVNALVIPDIEARGWTPVLIRVNTDPVASTRSATLEYLLPPPHAEVRALQRLLSAFPEAGGDPSIGEVLALYDALPVRDHRKRDLISPIEMEPSAQFRSDKVLPYLCRLLRSTIDLDAFGEHIAAIKEGAELFPAGHPPVTVNTTIRELLDLLSGGSFLSAYQSLLAFLDPPSRSLRIFFENLFQVYGPRRRQFGLVLLFDQFEEIFTRFVDPGSLVKHTSDLCDWRLRYELFEELKTLYPGDTAPAAHPGAENTPSADRRLPIRCLLSMRSEYIAQIEPIRSFAPEIDSSTYHLELLSTNNAEDAIKNPAKLFGYGYSDECYENIIKDLTKEERYIEPAHLSLVCEKLWNEKGRELCKPQESKCGAEVDLETYRENLKGAKGVLGAFFEDFLQSLDDEDSRIESLELLEPLITGRGTRNIVEYDQLAAAPFRNKERREQLIDRMVNRTILRLETRLGSKFVELTHEFLIPSIQQALPELVNHPLRSVLRTLDFARYSDSAAGAGTENILNKEEFRLLNDNRHKIVWDDFATEVMFRASICHGSDRDTIRLWSEKVAQSKSVREPFNTEEQFVQGELKRRVLSASGYRLVNERRSTLTLTTTQLESILRSALLHCTDQEQEQVRYWTRRITQ